MMRHAALGIAYIIKRLRVDADNGRMYWLDATKHHRNLVGKEAGCARKTHSGKYYWIIQIDGVPYRRSQLIFAVTTGSWPVEQVDHRDGLSLNDRPDNLRPATQMQNAWNHKGRRKRSGLPMGIRKLPYGRFEARITYKKVLRSIGVFDSLNDAVSAYQNQRKECFGEYA